MGRVDAPPLLLYTRDGVHRTPVGPSFNEKARGDASLKAMPPQPKDFVFQRGAAGEQKSGLMFVKMPG